MADVVVTLPLSFAYAGKRGIKALPAGAVVLTALKVPDGWQECQRRAI